MSKVRELYLEEIFLSLVLNIFFLNINFNLLQKLFQQLTTLDFNEKVFTKLGIVLKLF
jgi:hypothetical protein